VTRPERRRFLVLHDYGMGGVWWWVRAATPEEIPRRVAEVEVIDDPATMAKAEGWGLEVIDLDAVDQHSPLWDMTQTRLRQSTAPGFARLVGRDRVWLRRIEEEPGAREVYFTEHGHDGRRVRQVRVTETGERYRSTEEDWPFNPPDDLYDPELADNEILQHIFEDEWHRAKPEPEWD